MSDFDGSKVLIVLLVSHGATFHCIERLLGGLGAFVSEDRPIYNTAVSENEISLDKKGAMKSAKNPVSRVISHLAGKFVIKWVVYFFFCLLVVFVYLFILIFMFIYLFLLESRR